MPPVDRERGRASKCPGVPIIQLRRDVAQSIPHELETKAERPWGIAGQTLTTADARKLGGL